MASTFGILETAKSGLSISMQQLKITGHNISNANTVGYTRQRIITSAKESDSVYLIKQLEENQVGQGVEVISIQQVRLEYLDNQYRDLNSKYAYSDATTQSLTYLEGLFDSELTDGEGLTGSIEDFFSSLNTLNQDATSEEYRIAVQKAAASLTQNFNLVYGEMESLWEDQNTSIDTVAQSINSAAVKIAALNEAIARYERTGDVANDLRDERNLLLDELSGYVNITYENGTDSNGNTTASVVNVYIGDQILVDGKTANQITVDSDSNYTSEIDTLTDTIATLNEQIETALAADPSADVTAQTDAISAALTELQTYIDVSTTVEASGVTGVTYNGVTLVSGDTSTGIEDAVAGDVGAWAALNQNRLALNGEGLELGDEITGGTLYAHMEQVASTDSDTPGIPYYMEQLNALARSIAENINTIHKTGWSYDTDKTTATTTSETNIDFFATDSNGTYAGVTAGNFSISDAISESVWNIACSSTQVLSENTDSGNSEIVSQLYADLETSKYYSSLNGIVGHLAIALDTNESLLNTKQSLLNSVDGQRASVSGVSVDEETTNLIVFQQAYNANARVISAINEMLDVLINSMGV